VLLQYEDELKKMTEAAHKSMEALGAHRSHDDDYDDEK